MKSPCSCWPVEESGCTAINEIGIWTACCWPELDWTICGASSALGKTVTSLLAVRKGRLDLAGSAERALRTAGVARVDRLDACTACDPDRFFSHRRDRGLTGRQGAVAYIA